MGQMQRLNFPHGIKKVYKIPKKEGFFSPSVLKEDDDKSCLCGLRNDVDGKLSVFVFCRSMQSTFH